MSEVRYSKQAIADLRKIGVFTLEKWGSDQAEIYLDDLDDCCLLISQNPSIGRAYKTVPRTWKRLEHKSHVLLYSINRSGITIQRIIHKSRLLPPAI